MERSPYPSDRYKIYGEALIKADTDLEHAPVGDSILSQGYLDRLLLKSRFGSRKTEDSYMPCNPDSADEWQFDLGFVPSLGLYEDEIDALVGMSQGA